MIVYGRQPVHEALRGTRRVGRIWATQGVRRSQWLKGVDVKSVQPHDLEDLCGSGDHQGICAEVSPFEYADVADLLRDEDALVVALDEIQDPQNLGAVCRVAEVAGASGVVIPERRSAQVTAAVCRASAGAVEHLRIARVRNLADWLIAAKDSAAWIYGASTDEAAVPYDSPDYRGRVVVALGSEGRGLRPRVAGACDELIKLPVRGALESLNVATAAAAVVYGILRSRAGDR